MSSNVEQPLGLTPQANDCNPNGDNGGKGRFDPSFTNSVIDATGPKADPRVRKVIASLIKHAHDFCRENEITMSEFMAGVDMVSA